MEWIPAPGPGKNSFYMAQRTPDAELVLTANESFFPTLGLLATGEGGGVVDDSLNGGRNFEAISEWDAGDAAEWGLWFDKTGTATVRITMVQSEGNYQVLFAGQEQSFSTKSSDKIKTLSFEVNQPGKQMLRLTCEKESAKAQLRAVELSGPAIENAAVLRQRWRPSAGHCDGRHLHHTGGRSELACGNTIN